MTQDDTDPIGERIRAASRTVSAPLALRETLDRSQPSRARAYPSRLALAGIGLTLAALATLSGLLAPDAPSVKAVAAAALQAPERGAGAGDGYLRGYTPVGARTDDVEGRTARTVIYRRGGTGVHYTIVEGRPLDPPGSGETITGTVKGADYAAAEIDGRTCVLSSDTLDADALVALLKTI